MNQLEQTEQERLLEAQQKTINFVTDALFNRAHRKQNEYEMLDEAYHLSHRLELLLGKLVPMFADKNGCLAEAHDMAGDAMIDITAFRNDVRKGLE